MNPTEEEKAILENAADLLEELGHAGAQILRRLIRQGDGSPSTSAPPAGPYGASLSRSPPPSGGYGSYFRRGE